MVNNIFGPALAASIVLGGVTQGTAQELRNDTQNRVTNITQSHCSMDSVDTIVQKYTQPHTVLPGETMGIIAHKYGIPLSDFRELRELIEGEGEQQSRDWDFLPIGHVLRVPNNTVSDYATKKIRTHLQGVYKKKHDVYLNTLYRSGDIDGLTQELDKVTPTLFPKEIVTLGFNAIAQGLIGNMKQDFDPQHPLMVDKGEQHKVNCAGKIKKMISFSLGSIPEVRAVTLKQKQNAWILLGSLLEAGFTREDNLMGYMDKSKIGTRDVIPKNKEVDYYNAVHSMAKEMKAQGIPGEIVGAYFRGSNYKHEVKNEYEKRKENNETFHINTHMFQHLGSIELSFQADKVRDFQDSRAGEQMTTSIDIVNFMVNYMQEKAGYKAVRSKSRRSVIQQGLKNFPDILDVQVNGVTVDISAEINKNGEQRLQISPSDTITFSGPVVADGFHVKTSDNKYESENNTTRTIFLTQVITNPDFILSERIQPSLEMQYYTPTIGGKKQNIHVRNLLSLQQGDIPETVIKEGIIKYIFEKTEVGEYTPEQIKNLNEIEDQKKISRQGIKLIQLQNQRAKLRRSSLLKAIQTLTPAEKSELEREYARQIRAYQLLGYMQHAGKPNPNTTNANSPLPLIDTKKTNVDSIYNTYMKTRKKEIQQEFLNSCESRRDFLEVRFLEGDKSSTIYQRITSELERQSDKYPGFAVLRYLNPLQQKAFLREVVDKKSDSNAHLTKGKIPSNGNIIMSLEDIHIIVNKLVDEAYTVYISTNSNVDLTIVDTIARTEQEKRILIYIISQESYTQGALPVRKILKQLARQTGIRKISSFGDMQLRFDNLGNSENAFRLWPTRENLERAIAFLDSPEIASIIKRRTRSVSHRDVVNQDLETVKKIKIILQNLSEENRVASGKEITGHIEDLLRFDNGSGANSVGKTIGLSLLKDKILGHYQNLNAWVERSGESIDELIDSPELKKRYTSSILVVNHRGEKTALMAVGESYTLRTLQALGYDIKSPDFPEIKRNWNQQIQYTRKTVETHFSFYKEKLSEGKNNKISRVLEGEIEKLQSAGFSAQSFYSLFKNTQIQDFLKQSGHDGYFLPTEEEFSDPGIRRLLFDYATPPTERKPPDINSLPQRATNGALEFLKMDPINQLISVGVGIKLATPIVWGISKWIFLNILLLPFQGTHILLTQNPLNRRAREKKKELHSWEAVKRDFREKEANPLKWGKSAWNFLIANPYKAITKKKRDRQERIDKKEDKINRVIETLFHNGYLVSNIDMKQLWKAIQMQEAGDPTAIKKLVNALGNPRGDDTVDDDIVRIEAAAREIGSTEILAT